MKDFGCTDQMKMLSWELPSFALSAFDNHAKAVHDGQVSAVRCTPRNEVSYALEVGYQMRRFDPKLPV